MAAFATVADLAAFLDATIPDADPRAVALLDMASSVIRGYTRQHLEAVNDDIISLRPRRRTLVLLLPELPVRAVATVEVAGTALAPTAFSWDDMGVVTRPGSTWAAGQEVKVTYSHGYEVIPDELRAVCLQAAARAWENPGANLQESIGNYSVAYEKTRGLVELDDLERATLDRYRLRGMT